MEKIKLGLLSLVLVTGFAFAQTDTTEQTTEQASQNSTATGLTLADALGQDENFSTFRTALAGTDRSQQLRGEEIYTVFAPTNAAFSALPEETLASLNEGNPFSLHILQGAYTADVIQQMLEARGGELTLPTLDGENITFVLDDNGAVVINGLARLTDTGTVVGNGVLVGVDNVFATTATTGTGGSVSGGGEPTTTEGTQPTEATQPTDGTQETESTTPSTTEGGVGTTTDTTDSTGTDTTDSNTNSTDDGFNESTEAESGNN